MEQLTIKELSPYLPYDITIMFNKKYKGTLVGLLGNKWNLAEIKFEFGNDRKDIEVCYPVLRPLSDLIKEIEINGEKFVPIIEISKFLLGDRKVEDYGFSENKHYYYCETSDSINRQYCIFLEEDDLSLNISKKNFKMLEDRKNNIRESYSQLEYYNMLYKWHFDVFGLIKKGLAIDINTIK